MSDMENPPLKFYYVLFTPIPAGMSLQSTVLAFYTGFHVAKAHVHLQKLVGHPVMIQSWREICVSEYSEMVTYFEQAAAKIPEAALRVVPKADVLPFKNPETPDDAS